MPSIFDIFLFTPTFAHGCIVGALFVLSLNTLFIVYVVFEKPIERVPYENNGRAPFPVARTTHSTSSSDEEKSTIAPEPVRPEEILAKTKYDLSSHATEGCDWINVLLAQALAGYRSALNTPPTTARDRLQRMLFPTSAPTSSSWIDPIKITNLSLGSTFPLFSAARVRPSDDSGQMRAEIEIDWEGGIGEIEVETAVVVNWPREGFARLPVKIGVRVERVCGTLAVSLHPSALPTIPSTSQELHISLHPDFHLTLVTTSLLGSRAKLQDLPKIEQIIESKVRSAVSDLLVWPKYFGVGLPGLGSRVEEGAVSEDEDAEEGDGEVVSVLGEMDE